MRLQMIIPEAKKLAELKILDYDCDEDEMDYIIGEADCSHALEILNMEYTDGILTLNEGFDLSLATNEVCEYLDYLDSERLTEIPDYYQELLDYNNNWLGDDTAYDYAGSFVLMILDMVSWCLENDSFVEVE